MSTQAQQPALKGLAPRKTKPRLRTAARNMPIVGVVLDIQAAHLGQIFDYVLEEKYSASVVPGSLVRVRFGHQRVTGIVWERKETSDTDPEQLKFVERVLSAEPVLSDEMRSEIEQIAHTFGATYANIIRLALPSRVAWVEQAQRQHTNRQQRAEAIQSVAQRALEKVAGTVTQEYGQQQCSKLNQAFAEHRFSSFVVDALPHWRAMMAWMIASALAQGLNVVCVLPTARTLQGLSRTLTSLGLRLFAPFGKIDESVQQSRKVPYTGDFVTLTTNLPVAERYRAYYSVAQGQVTCVLGARGAMYAPVQGRTVYICMDDSAYQQADGMAPYAQARSVMKLRAKREQGVFIAFAQARSVMSQWEIELDKSNTDLVNGVSGPSGLITPEKSAITIAMPWVRWLNRDALAKIADQSIGSRVPHTVVRVVNQALEQGPVLVVIAQDSAQEVLCCATCKQLARCARCSGPLYRTQEKAASCSWCGSPALRWQCDRCSGIQLRPVRIGASGTVEELQQLFRHASFVVSTSQYQPIQWIDTTARIVVATAGYEPQVRDEHGRPSAYSAVVILDTWVSLYMPGLDARIDTERAWMGSLSLCTPREQGGQVLLVGEADPAIAEAVLSWNTSLCSEQELEDRKDVYMPPVCSAARVWGERNAVETLLKHIRQTMLQHGANQSQGENLNETMILGPIALAPMRTSDTLEIDTNRAQAVIKVIPRLREQLARELHFALAQHMASGKKTELKFALDPKDIVGF